MVAMGSSSVLVSASAESPLVEQEFLELAVVCEEVANDLEDRGG
jgi:hypothetical protein